MADLLLSALVPIVVQKSADMLVQRIGEMWGIADQRERLHDKLLAVQAVLTDAEEQGDANPAVKSWLAKLKSAAYDADDVLDEFHYEELHRDAVRCDHKVGNVSGFFSLKNRVLFRFKMSRKLKEVVGRIDELVTEMERFKFVQGQQGRAIHYGRTHSFVIESEVLGREDDKDELVKLLTKVCPTENLRVLPVVGMGGLGKTTLAQLVYNNPRIKEHFTLLAWVCVSQEFDVGLLAKLIIDSVVLEDCNVPHDNMDLLQRRLRQEISGKRYLLVLDDVWDEKADKWEQLRDLLNCGDLGSVVVVTTRSGIVANIMGTMPSYNLGCLGEDQSWSLFHRRAFNKGVKECQELVEIGRKLVKKCGGLPLAIKTLGSLMSYKYEVREWLTVLEQSTIWEERHTKDKVLSILRLSYDHLPSYMKQCFAFCAVFPKDYVMEKEKLVQYWMAHGFIPSDELGNLEMTGSDIFNELAWRSFFQDVQQVHWYYRTTEHGYRSQTMCKMHDLMHDLAKFVMRDEFLSLLESSQINNTPQCNVRHISLIQSYPMHNIKPIERFPTARSLISFEELECRLYLERRIRFVKSNCLRVLDLSVWSIDKIMVTPGNMKHLRYLDLSRNATKQVPEAITTLYFLQTLRLFGCSNLSKLPEGMRYMKSLRHLYNGECFELKCMPPGLEELQYLQTLTYYIVGTGVGNRIGELKTLNLGGQLEVYNLREVKDARDARQTNMVSKQNLDHLALCWGMPNKYSVGVRSNGSETVVVDLEVLDALKPCNKLKVLRIKEYRGDKFPVWMTEYHMLENLVELHIIECTRCTNVPPLHRLPLLQILMIELMDNLRHLCWGVFMSAEGDEDAPVAFRSLKTLSLLKMANLQFWCESDVGEKTPLIFPVLSELWIIDCPRLSAIPVTPLLEKMVVEGNMTLSCFATGLTTLRSLTLRSRGGRENNADETLSFKPWESPSFKPCVSLEDLTIQGFNHIIPPTDGREGEELSVDVNATSLRRLTIYSSNFWFSLIPSNSPLWLWKCFTFLELLYIKNCDSLIYWPEEELSNLIHLRKMEVESCMYFLGSLSKTLSEMTTRQVLLPKLTLLTISNCPNMVEVPKLPRSLEILEISSSTKLECLPEWLGSLVALKQLQIYSCESLNSLPSSIGGLTALRVLDIWRCLNMVEVPEPPRSLETLRISYFTKLECLPEWLGSLVALKELQIDYCESLNSFPSSLGCLTVLRALCISMCPNIVEVPQLPRSLEILEMYDCKKLERLPEWLGSLVALKKLEIKSCESLNSFPSSVGCLTALEMLDISGCINLASLPEGMQGLEALKTLRIVQCPKIRILPEGLLQRLRSLYLLQIQHCPLLERDFRKHSKYWHLISDIRIVMIGEGGRSSKIGDQTRLISSCKIPWLSAQS